VNAVFILWPRQLKRYLRSRTRMIGSLGQPTLFLLALGFGLGPTFARAGHARNAARITQPPHCGMPDA
jgi:ABC-2 type transport system permease protein